MELMPHSKWRDKVLCMDFLCKTLSCTRRDRSKQIHLTLFHRKCVEENVVDVQDTLMITIPNRSRQQM